MIHMKTNYYYFETNKTNNYLVSPPTRIGSPDKIFGQDKPKPAAAAKKPRAKKDSGSPAKPKSPKKPREKKPSGSPKKGGKKVRF